jgi:hypothetical protein
MSKPNYNDDDFDAFDILEEEEAAAATADSLDLTESKGDKKPKVVQLSPEEEEDDPATPSPPRKPAKIQYRTLQCEGNTAMDGILPSAPQALMTLDEATQQFIIQVVDENNPSFFLVIRIPQKDE